MLINDAPVLTRSLWHTVDPLAECREQLHKTAFAARHPLAGHPLFSIEALTKVAEAACKRKDDVYVDAGDLSLADKWGSTPKPDMTIPEIIDRIETAGAWLVMKHVEENPAYKALLNEYEAFVREVAGPEGSKLLSNAEMLVFITSPHRKTPFHFDAEINFLVQIQGSKDLWVCDPLDRSVTTEEELEQYYYGAINAGTYKPHAEKVAQQFTLHPGDAVHIPTHGAHWVQNHDNVSISLSLNMEFPQRYGDAYRANHYLRMLGLKPRPPGASEWLDRSKAATVYGLRQVKSLLKR
ncbi:JmjC domain-containing protein [Paraburkholderia tropica]|uniref:cupin-like domain-containing protein n=1 Tax=Paraburkholderia TaxID=1822464 RepID=UPI001CAD6DB4|nr:MULTISPECIES: cupin-like domain-containing protein [Paraburkholderia]CAG9224236.1 JmjC domain-containing protein [Paraburkholderia tropica]